MYASPLPMQCHQQLLILTTTSSMNSANQIRNAVANIQDELQRIVACADLNPLEQNHVAEEFKNKLIAEFNTKLRGFKTKIRSLNEENHLLKLRVADLEHQLGQNSKPARPSKSLTSLPQVRPMLPPKRHRDSEEKVEISSSPIKGNSQQGPESRLDSRPDLTSSQLNHLPTQYSDASETVAEDNKVDNKEGNQEDNVNKSPVTANNSPLSGKKRRKKQEKFEISPVKGNFIEEDDRVVADSQDEFEALGEGRRGHPSHYTALQRIDFLRNYYRMKLADTKYRIDLLTNPITEKPWVAADFQPNAHWTRPKHLNSHVGVMTKQQEQNYDRFFQEAGHGMISGGPQWEVVNSAQAGSGAGSSDSEKENSAGGAHWVRSQVMDKYLSPPGFMVASFPNSQEEAENKARVARKNLERINRRVASALSQGEFIFFEEVLNTYVAQSRYTRHAKH